MIIIPIIIMIGLIISVCYFKADMISKKIIVSYSITMSLLVGISMFNPVGLYKVSFYTYILLIINIVCVALSILITSNFIVNKEEDNRVLDCDNIIKSRAFLIMQICVCIILIYYTCRYFILISDLHPSQIRIARFTMLFNSAFETLFYNYIVSGTVTISGIIFSILLANKKIKNIPFVFIIINIILFSLIGFGRMTIFSTIITTFFAFLFSKNFKEKINKKNIIKLLIIFLIIFVIFSIMIFIRMNTGEKSLIERIFDSFKEQITQIFEYFLGSIRMLDRFINEGFSEFKKYTYGRATLAGIDEIILYPLKGIGLEIESFNNKADDIMSNSYRIGENTPYYNAFYTGVMNFYLDFGIIGVFIFSILHGILISIAIKQYKTKNDIYSLILLIFLLNNLMLTIINWGYQSGSTTFTLIIIVLINFIVNKIERKK